MKISYLYDIHFIYTSIKPSFILTILVFTTINHCKNENFLFYDIHFIYTSRYI